MIYKKEFELIPYYKNTINSDDEVNFTKYLDNNIREDITKIINYFDAILIQECNYFEKFSGRDIDTFYISNLKFLDVPSDKNFFFHQRDNGSFRFFINFKDSNNFLNLDIEDLKIFSPKTKKLNTDNIQEAIICDKTRLKHFKLNAIIYYKIVKYFSHGIIFSYKQLYKLKKTLNSLKPVELDHILNLTSKNLPKESFFIKKLIENDFKVFEQDNDIKNFWIKKRIIRQNKRIVFKGKFRLKNLIKSKKFIYALFLGSYAKWPKNHNPLPAIAIIGNDGSGKTTICEYIVNNFYKMDPVYINMKTDVPLMSITKYLSKFLKKILNYELIKKFSLLRITLSFVGQSMNILDQYLKYRIGMAFADSGFGITIFERYITDKLRGEFPNKKNKFLPLEQFFPFPDGFFYLDVMPEISVERKINDNHSISEMTSKRKNYISLLEEFSEVNIINCDNKFEDNVKALKNYIFELALKKTKQFKSGSSIKRCLWKKNRNRVLAGNSAERFQKRSFL